MVPPREPTSGRMGLSAPQISAGLGRFPHDLVRTARFRHPRGTSRMRLNSVMRRFRSAFAPDFVRRELPAPCLQPLTGAMSIAPPAITRCPHRTLRPVNISMKSVPPWGDSDAKVQHLGTLGLAKERSDFPSLSAAFRCISRCEGSSVKGKSSRLKALGCCTWRRNSGWHCAAAKLSLRGPGSCAAPEIGGCGA